MPDVHVKTAEPDQQVWGSHSVPQTTWRVYARRPSNPDAYLIVDADDTDEPPAMARVVDRSLLRAYQPYATHALLAAGEWEILSPDEPIDVETVMANVRIFPSDELHARLAHQPVRETSSGDLSET